MQPLSTSFPEELLADIDVILWKADSARHFTFISRSSEQILGFPCQEWLQNPNLWMDQVHPEDRARVMQARHGELEGSNKYTLEYRMFAADGRIVWLKETVSAVRDQSGAFVHLLGLAADITETKIQEQKYHEQTSRYEQMAQNIQEIFWMIEVPSQRALYVNAAFESMTGYKAQRLLESPLFYQEIIHPDDRAHVLSQLTKSEQTGKLDEQFRIQRADGIIRWVSARGFPIRDEKGTIYRFAGVVQDVTERRVAELALVESEDRYRDLVEHSHDLLCTHDLTGKLLSCNPAPARLLGYSVEELLQIPMRQLLAPEARVLFDEYLAKMERDGAGEGLMVLMTRSGERRFWHYHNTLRSSGVPSPVVRGMARDVTDQLRAEKALRSSEERFRVAVKNARVMVYTQNRSLQYTWIYNSLLAWSEQDCLSKSDEDFLHPEEAYRLRAIKQWVLDTGAGSRVGVEITLHERKYYLDLTVEPLFDSSGSVIGITCASTDITELHDKAERLQLLLEINSALISKLEFRKLVQALSPCIHRLFRQDFLSMSICQASKPGLISYPLDVASLGRLNSIELGLAAPKSLAGRALSSGEIELFGESEIGNAGSEFLTTGHKEPLRSLACIPLETSKGRIATLNIGSNREHAFSAADFYLMQQLGAVIAAAMDNADAFSALRLLRDRLRDEKLYLEEELRRGRFTEMVGESLSFKEMWERAEAVTELDSTVILYGENGVGKELLARTIHHMSSRRPRTFIKVDCACVAPDKLERELFGYESTSEAGDTVIHPGRLELADNSTLLLEEVHELAPELQKRILSLLEERQFERVGGNEPHSLNVRLIASSTANVRELVDRGAFLADLFYELNAFPIQVPALRDRRDDIPVLARHFVEKYARRLKRKPPVISGSTMNVLQSWHWPGNVRELENFIERSVILTTGEQLEAPLWELRWGMREVLRAVLTDIEREQIVRALQETDGAIAGPEGAAARLGLKPTSLETKIQRLGIKTPRRQKLPT